MIESLIISRAFHIVDVGRINKVRAECITLALMQTQSSFVHNRIALRCKVYLDFKVQIPFPQN